MKKKSNYRTPKRLLSLFLSVLLLLSSFVFASPTVSKAATTITHKPSYSSQKFTFHCTQQNYTQSTTVVNLENSKNSYVSRDFARGSGDSIAYAYSVYDYNSNAINYDIPKFDSSKIHCYSGTSISPSYEYVIYKHMMGQERPFAIVKRVVYGINTTGMIDAYDNAMSTIGTVNTEHYTTNTWNNYISALNSIKSYIDRGGAGYSYNGGNPQGRIYNAENNLRKAISLLSKAEVSLGNIFNQVDGATLSGPEKVYVGDEFEVTVKLQEGYTKSVPTLTVVSGSTTKTVTGTKASDGSYKFKVTLTSEENNSITPANVDKNTYTVTVPSSGTGFTASKSGTVTHGENYTFTVKLLDGYTQTLPTVKAGTVTLGATPIGNNTYSYTITGVKADTSVSINGVVANTYSVGYSLGAGVSKASGTATSIKHFGTATVKLTVDAAHSQRTPAPTVTNGTLSAATKNGNTYTYTLKGVTADTTVTVPALAKNQYTVTVPTAIGLDITNTGSHTKTYGDSFTFTVTKKTGYTQATPVVKVNDTEIAGVLSDNTYTYTIENITENKNVTIDNMPLNTYQYTLPTGAGFTVANAAGMDCTSITHGNDYSFTVTVDKAYTQTEPTVTLASGKALELVSKASGADGSIVYTYKAANVTANDTVQVAAMSKNTYSAVLPYDKTEEASYKVTNEKADGNNVVSGIVYGTDLTFGVALAEQYNRSTVVVKYNGSVLTPDEGGVYTIKNVTQNITEGDIVVEGVELNHYYITLPLETETGFTIIVGEGQNAKSVLSGTDFDFKFFLDPAYSNSNPVIKYSADGGDNYSVLTEKDGKYTIENVLSDCIVVVEGVKKNTYTVNFTQENGTIIKQYTDVEYGAEVVFDGTEPTKASEKLNEYEEDGNKVVVTKEYKFVGWSADTTKVVSNMTVTPIFEVSEVKTTTPIGGGESTVVVTPKTANILFISGGVIVHKETIEKGKGFSGWDGTPVKTSSNPYETYTFTGWDTDRDGVVDVAAGESNAIADVQNDVTYTAVFESNLPSQTVEFRNFDGSELLYSASVKRGEKAEYGLSAIPSRTDNTNTYDFAGWAFETDADESKVVESFIVGESDVKFYAAYSRKPIVYSYKFVNDGELLQAGSFYNGDYYRYLGSTPIRASSVSTDYTFDDWKIAQSGYDTIYTAIYSESVREYTSNLPTADGTYTITDNATIPYGDTFSFTVTVAEGYEETAPVVTSNGTAIEPASKSGNSYTYEIKLDGAMAEEVYGDLTVTVGTTINNYDVKISGDEGCTVDPLAFNSAHGGEGSFIVTLKDGYTQTEPTINFEGDVAVTLDKAEGNVYTYKVTGIKSDAKITVETAINTYKVVMVNYDGSTVFDDVLAHGATPEYTNPTKPTDKFGGYTFKGWDLNGDGNVDVTAIANVTGDINAKAVYECNHVHAEDPTAEGTAWLLDSIEQATCTEDGVRHYKCSYPGCTETKDWTIKARGHEMGEYTVTLAPTCTEDGSKIRYCVNAETDDYAKCNHSETAVVEKLGHAYGEWKTIVAPTCTEKGKAERVCANDPSHKEYKDVPATGHHDSDEDYVCDDCGLDLGHCSKCICHKGNILSKVLRYICTLLTKTFHKPIKCCKDMDWYGDKISSIT